MKPERRSFKGELRAERSSDGKVFVTGRAASYNTRSENLGWGSYGIYEELEPGCFDDVDDSETVHCIDHDPARLLGKTASGTLTLATDGRGLTYRSELPDTTWARDLAALIKRGDASFSSFAFSLAPDGSGETWSEIPDPEDPSQSAALRTITRVEKLFDVSTLTGHPPAYPGTAAALSDRFATMPAELRARIFRATDLDDGGTPNLDADLDQAAVDDADECLCDCESCLVDGDCEGCADQDCLDEACRESGCPMQDAGDRSLPGAGGDVAAVVNESNELALEEAMEEP